MFLDIQYDKDILKLDIHKDIFENIASKNMFLTILNYDTFCILDTSLKRYL